MRNLVMRLWREDEGQDLVEYALLVVLVALAAVAAMSTLANSIGSAFGNAGSRLTST
jgi:pilus assembly protein Flp/PilA